MNSIIDYLPGIDLAGLVLAMLLVWRANQLEKQNKAFLKQADADAQRMQHA